MQQQLEVVGGASSNALSVYQGTVVCEILTVPCICIGGVFTPAIARDARLNTAIGKRLVCRQAHDVRAHAFDLHELGSLMDVVEK